MKVLCIYSDCGPSYVRTGWGRVFTALGHEFYFWRPELKPALDVFGEVEPDIFLGTTYELDRAVQKAITRRPHLKVALYASAWGPLARCVPDEFPITRVSPMERVAVESLKRACGKPDFVFSHVGSENLLPLLGGWREAGVEPVGIQNAADTFSYLGGQHRDALASDVAYVGGYWPYKAQNLDPYILPLCHPASGLRVKIFGNQPWPVPQYLGPIAEESVKDVFVSARVCPNVSEPHSVRFGYDVVERPFKVMAAGGFCISDAVGEMSALFAPGDLMLAHSPEDFHDKIGYYVAHPEKREPFIKAGRRRVLAEHTYFHRVATMFTHWGLEAEAALALQAHRRLVLDQDPANMRPV